ncbi:MAG TPA: hypothetical protein VKY73_10945 [Polyangiaceae bacterium]|nr:hypothetical protein [Polyangiaceae bacterium]
MSASVAGCEGCRSEKPYTPFGVASALPTVSASVSASASAAAPPEAPTAVKRAFFAPREATRLNVGEVEIESPRGRVFEQALTTDVDGDGRPEVVAWTLPAPGASADTPPGELFFYAPESEARRIFGWPTFLPSGPECTHTTALAQSSGRTITLDVKSTCKTPLIARAPTRALAVIDPQSTRSPLFGIRAADGAPGETLSVELSSRDADQDGRDDFALTIGVGVASAAPRASVDFLWFDRALGASRDPERPRRALRAALDGELSRAQKAKTAEAALLYVEGLRRTLASACAEGGTPRVFDWDGTALRCEMGADVIDRANALDVTARLTQGDLSGALGALVRDGWYFGALSPARRKALREQLGKRLRSVPVTRVGVNALPRPAARPRYSPLSFLPDGTLLVQSASGLVRLGPDLREELAPPDLGLTPWPLEVTTPSGERLAAVTYSCDRPEIALLLVGAGARSLPIPMLAPRPGVCRGGPFDERVPPAPVSAGTSGVELVLGGELVSAGTPPTGPVPPGSARSRDGKHVAIATPFGLYVRSGASGELWTIDGWEAVPGTDCVVANGAGRAACIRGARAELYVK